MYDRTYLNGVLVWVLDGEVLPYIAGGKGGGSTTTTVQLPAPTANQTETEGLNLDMLKRQNVAFTEQMALQDPARALAYLDNPGQGNSILQGLEKQDSPQFRQQLQDAIDQQTQNKSITDLAQKKLQQDLTGEAVLSPAQQANLDTQFKGYQDQGETDIAQFLKEQAAMRGLNVADSPIAAEGARQIGKFQLGLQSAKAGAALNLGESQKIFDSNVQQFQQSLQQQAALNRMSLGSGSPGLASPMMNYFGQQRMAGATTTSNQTLGQNWWTPLVGAGLQGGGMALGAGLM